MSHDWYQIKEVFSADVFVLLFTCLKWREAVEFADFFSIVRSSELNKNELFLAGGGSNTLLYCMDFIF